MNIEQARTNMLTQQLRTWEVLDQTVLDLITHIPREHFVPAAYANLAFADTNIPLAHEQVMLTPREEARILQTLNISPTDHVLEIGTGSGYMTALLASLAAQVDSVDLFADFTQSAAEKLSALNITNTTLLTGDAARGWKGNYDVVVITGSLAELPASFYQCVKSGGRLFAILGQAPAMEATLFTQATPNHWQEKKIFETVVPPLLNSLGPTKFVF
jgi:protein-L-isoaspartate(D-aspartate) O-methyltransferase